MPTLPPLELQPGKALGPFELGMALFETFDLLRFSPAYGSISLTHDATSPQSTPLILSLANSLRLVYSAQNQRLLLIELVRPCSHTILWKGSPLCATSSYDTLPSSSIASAAQRLLNNRFGPTYPPSSHPAYKNEMVCAYNGVVFAYKDETSNTTKLGRVNQAARVSSSQDSGDILSRMVVSLHDPSRAGATAFPVLEELDKRAPITPNANLDRVHVQLSGSFTTISLHYLDTASSELLASPIDLTLGESTSEDLICDLGSPQRVYHPSSGSPSLSSNTSSEPTYIMNYLSLGIDFVLSTSTHTILRIILHGNTPGEVQFGRYHRARWVLSDPKVGQKGGNRVGSEDKASTVKDFLSGRASSASSRVSDSPSSATIVRPLILDRTANSGLPTYQDNINRKGREKSNMQGIILEDRKTELFEYKDRKVTLEVTREGWVETVWIG